jgi:GLPGLI family protein
MKYIAIVTLCLIQYQVSIAQKLSITYDTQLLYPFGNAKSYTGTLYVYSSNYSVFELNRTTNSGTVEGEVYGQKFRYPATKFKYKEYIVKYFDKDYQSYVKLADRKKDVKTYKNNELIQWQEITDTLQTIDWQMHAEKKNILGFNCQLATGYFKGSKYAAWFTTDIPYMDGPWKFNGLPGLIMEVECPSLDIRIVATGIKNAGISFKPDIPSYEPFEKITWGKFVEREVKLAKQKKEKSKVMNENTNVVSYANDFYTFFDVKYTL